MSNNSLKILSFNATSIRGKLPEFNSHFDSYSSITDYDVISLTETWLNDTVHDEEILIHSNYNIFRRDRDHTVSSKKDGGGVLIAINPNLLSKRRYDLETSIEIIWIECKMQNGCSIYLCTVYLPPYSNMSVLRSLEESLDKVCDIAKCHDSIIILGDFNMSDALWKFNLEGNATCVNLAEVCNTTSFFLDIVFSNDFRQHNTLPTCNDKPLDLVITNNLPVSVNYANNPVSSTHQALEACVTLPCKPKVNSSCPQRTVYNFKKADFDAMHRLLACLCWSNLLSFVSANHALSIFYDIIFAILSDCVPVVKTRNSKFPYWYSKDLIALIKEKECARRTFVKTGRNKDSDAYKIFSSLRSEVKAMQSFCHTNYVKQISDNIKDNPKRFWSYVKSLKNSKTLPSVMIYNGDEITTLRDIAKAFCQYFESVFSTNTTVLPECNMYDVPSFRLSHVTPKEMKAEILSLDRHTNSGYDSVPVLLLLECAEELSYPLAKIFNMSVNEGNYPSLLKFNNVIPIYKLKGDKACVESYRPISIQPLVSKLFERLVNRALRNHISQLICDEQHGFCPMKSTTSNLLCYKDFVTSAFDDNVQVHSIYTDFHKAFDSVSHELLLLKMESCFGISGNELKWFRSYLSNRFQRVVITGVESDWVKVTSGVPQGSILGPSLFIMYVNDLPSCLSSSKCLLFADDVKIFKRISSLTDCINLQSDLVAFSHWCSKWFMKLNLAKCHFMNFSLKRSRNVVFEYFLDGSVLTCVTSITDLGVSFSSNMSFSLHVTKIVNKALRMLGFIKRTLKPFRNTTVFKVLYNSYVRSRLDYCSPVWSPDAKYLIDKVERVQKRFIKHLCFINCIPFENERYASLCDHFQLTTLAQRRKITDLTLFHKILHGKVNCPYLLSCISFNLPRKRTRHTDVFTIPKRKSRLKVRNVDFFPRTTKIINSTPEVDFCDCALSKKCILSNF